MSIVDRILELHKPWTYSMKNLGNIEFCEHCRDSTGKNFVSYPCPTVRSLEGEK